MRVFTVFSLCFHSLSLLTVAIFVTLTVFCAWSSLDIEYWGDFVCVMFQVKVVSPKHRLIKVDSQEFGRCKVPLSPVTIQEEPVRTDFIFISSILCFHFIWIAHFFSLESYFLLSHLWDALCFSLPTKVVPSAPAASDADTDYSDPFDVRPDPRGRPNWEPKSAPTDCCSYMEPFEAQRIISGKPWYLFLPLARALDNKWQSSILYT